MAKDTLQLPEPVTTGGMPLAEALLRRRSVRAYGPGALGLGQLSQLLWAAQGVTSEDGLRCAPSAGALYPLEIHVAVGAVEGVDRGLYRYAPAEHELVRILAADVRAALAAAAFDQPWVRGAAVVLACSAVAHRTTGKYGERGLRYVQMEAGHVAQNVLLQATALGLHSVVVGAFDDTDVHQTLTSPHDAAALCLLPIGPPIGR